MIALAFNGGAVAGYAILSAPIIGALAAFALPSFRAAWIVSAVAALATVASACLLAAGAGAAGSFGFRFDALARAAAPIIAIAGALCVLSAAKLAREDAGPRAATLALALVQIGWFGWLGAAFAGHFLLMFGFLQVGWISTCGLLALGAARDRAALSAAARHLAWGATFGVLFAIGIGLVFNAGGALAFHEISPASAHARALAAGLALMIVSIAGAAGLAPLNAWATIALDRGGRLAALFLASAGFAAMLAALTRIAMSAPFAGPEIAHGASVLLAALGTASLAIGSVQAIGAQDLRRLAAYACAAQAGAVALSLAFLSPGGAAAGLTHVAAQTLAALGILGGAAAIEERAPLAALDGMGRRAPFAGAAIAVSALSIVGAPLTLGFISRWRLVESALQAGWWWAAGALIAASLAAVVYVGRLVERLYLRAPPDPAVRGARARMLAPAHVVVIAATIGLGLDASGLWRIALEAGEALLAPR